VLSSVAVKLESSTETVANLSQDRTQTPKFVTSNDIGNEIGVIFSLFLEHSADSNEVFLLITASSLGTHFSALCRMLRSSKKIHWHVPYDSPTMLQMS
jgi:hypothetical protein